MREGYGLAGQIGAAFIDSKVTPLLVVASLALGALAVSLTPREEEPQIVVPMVDLMVGMPGAGPREVETRIAMPLERLMWQIPGVEYVYSSSMDGAAMVTVRFFVGEDEQLSIVKIYDKIAGNLDRIPPGATIPLVKLRSIDDVPVLGLTLWGEGFDAYALRRMAAQLRSEISSLPDVSDVRLIGGEQRRVRVLLDRGRLAAFGIDPGAVGDALAMHNASAPSGSFETGNREVLVETGAFLTDVGQVAALVVGVHDGAPVYLRDVAQVEDGPADPDTYVFYRTGAGAEAGSERVEAGLHPAVTVSVAKRKGADANRLVGEVQAKVDELRGRLLPQGLHIETTRDYGATAAEKARELLLHLTGAILSVTFVIALALGWRGALVVFVSVPVSFALTLFVYYVFGYTLNRVTLFALIFVTGIVVDDSIIVVENIVRHFARHAKTAREAAIEAVNEVGNPTILATLTVIAAVLPMAFVRGLMGPYMRPMPVGASLAMTFSLMVALMASPWFAYRLLRKSAEGPPAHEGHGGPEGHDDEDAGSHAMERWYRRAMLPLLTRPRMGMAVIAVTVVLLLGSVALVPLKLVAVKMLPFDNKSEMQVVLDLPEGTTLETTTQVAQEVAARLAQEPEVTNLQIYSGTAAPINFNGLVRHYDLRSGANVADVQVNLLHKDERDDQSHPIAKRLRPLVQEIAARHGAAAKVVEVPPGPPVLSTLVAEIYGPTEEERIAVARQVLEVFRATPNVVDVDWWVEDPQRKIELDVDREKAALQGVAPAQVVRTVRLALSGEDAGLLHVDELEPVTIRLELPRAERSSAQRLGELRIASRPRQPGQRGSMVPLSELVNAEERTLEPSRHRKNLRPVVYVTAEVAGDAESPVYAILAMKESLGEIQVAGGGGLEQFFRSAPPDWNKTAMKWDGEWHITYEVFRDLGAAFGVVLVLIYFLLVGWFRSFKIPLVMMIAIPLSLVGILPGHLFFGAFFTATSMIGFIALAGIMVRNSVLLMDFTNLSLERGRTLGEAVLEAGAVRLRPIVLTAGTVVVGAFVILFDPIFQGLAISLLTGAFASTVLTLAVVPLVYFLTERHRYEQPVPPSWLESKEEGR